MFTWNTGPGLCLTINWCKKASRGAALNATEKRTQVTYWHLLNERGPVFTEIPPLKYLSWKHRQWQHVLKRDHSKPGFYCPFCVTVITITLCIDCGLEKLITHKNKPRNERWCSSESHIKFWGQCVQKHWSWNKKENKQLAQWYKQYYFQITGKQ